MCVPHLCVYSYTVKFIYYLVLSVMQTPFKYTFVDILKSECTCTYLFRFYTDILIEIR